MKVQVSCLLVLLGVALAKETYSTENDNFDIGVFKDLVKLKAMVDCFNEKSSCDPVASAFKKDLGEAIQQSCAKCTDAQKHIMNGFINSLKENSPQDYEAFKQKYDPEGKHFVPLESAVAKF